MPTIHAKNLSLYFKDFGKELGWTNIHNYTRKNPSAGGKVVHKGDEFYTFLKSSTLRRTFASMAVNIWKLPLSEIIKVTGHSTVTQLMQYVRTDELQLTNNLKTSYEMF